MSACPSNNRPSRPCRSGPCVLRVEKSLEKKFVPAMRDAAVFCSSGLYGYAKDETKATAW